MKVLTVCQPYAEMIARGEKLIENRTWSTPYRGPMAIHAGKSRSWLEYGDELDYPNMAFGAVIAIADLVACVPVWELPYEEQKSIHANGPWCWKLANVRRINPVLFRGAQGLWNWHPTNEEIHV